MTKIISILPKIISIILIIDVIGFVCWVSTNQLPVDNFYIGIITKNILQVIFF